MSKDVTRSALLTTVGGMFVGFAFGVASLNIARADIALLLSVWSGLLAIAGVLLIAWATRLRERALAALG
ncbi:MAG: hypothetical protein U0470_10150 [Anaerolineae bacterium]